MRISTRLHAFARFAASLTLACSGAGALAQASVITFDDLGPIGGGGVMLQDGYKGFEWGDRYYYMANAATPTAVYIALGASSSTLIRRMDGAPFYFDGADYFSRRGIDATGDFYFVLYYRGQAVYNGVTAKKGGRMRFTGVPTLLRPDYTGLVDMVAIAFDGNGKDWNHLAFDNLRYRLPTPALK